MKYGYVIKVSQFKSTIGNIGVFSRIYPLTKPNAPMKKLLCMLSLGLSCLYTQAFPGLIGTEITYRDLGNNQYEINIYMFEPCSVSYNFTPPIVTARCSSTTLSLSPVFVSKTDISAASLSCNFTSCNGGIGYWKWRFSDTLDLSGQPCCEWTIGTQMISARNATTGSNGQVFYNYCTLNKCVSNMSFEFKQEADFHHAYDRDIALDFEAENPLNNLDSISYELVAAMQNLNMSVTYSGSFSPSRPMTFFGFPNQNLQWPAGCRLTSTGTLLFRPKLANQVFVTVVEAKLWRLVNGTRQVVGIIRRDIEGRVYQSSSNAAPFLESASTSPFTGPIYLSAGLPKAFSLYASDTTATDTVRIEIVRKPAYLNSSLVTNSLRDTLHIDAQAGLNDTAVGIPDTLQLRLYDLRCPNQKIILLNLLIYVLPKPDLQFVKDSSCARWTLTQSVSVPGNSLLPLSSRWDIFDPARQQLVLPNPNLAQQELQQGPYYAYVYYGYQGMQEWVDSFYLNNLNPYLNVSHTLQRQDTVCFGDTAFLSLNLMGDTNKYKSHWFLASDSSNRSFQAEPNGLHVFPSAYTASEWVNYWVYDAAGCVYIKDSARVKQFTVPQSHIADTSFCEGDSFKLQINQPEGYQILWSTASTDTFAVFTLGGNEWLKFEQNGYCPDVVDSFKLTLVPKPELQRFSDTLLCLNEAFSVGLVRGAGNLDFYWNGNPISAQNSMTWGVPGNHVASVKCVNRVGCADSFSFTVTVQEPLSAVVAGGLYHGVCNGDSLLVNAGIPAPGYSLLWTNGSSDSFNYLTAGLHELVSISPEACKKSVFIRVNSLQRPNPGFAVSGNSLNYQFSAFSGFPFKHYWDFGDGATDTIKTPSHQYPAGGNYTVKHRILDDQGCDSTAEQVISVVNSVFSEKESSLRFYPVPSTGRLFVDWQGNAPELLSLSVYDIAGKQIWSTNLNETEYEMNLSELAPGSYYLTWQGATLKGMRAIQISP
ncbi:MAG: T9SS type A sorting domain-containing protein [Bacteroidetes bacterium]|nr:MAG: T9SS type A sorting domain-containing protein [Bacteroidota bacterium]